MLWMAVTPDRFELPCAVAVSAEALSRMTGENVNNIRSQASRHDHCGVKSGKGRKGTYRFYKVAETEEE